MGEPLNETAFGKGLVVIGKHWVTGGSLGVNGTAAMVEHDLIPKIALSPWLFFTPADNISFEAWSKKYKMEVRYRYVLLGQKSEVLDTYFFSLYQNGILIY